MPGNHTVDKYTFHWWPEPVEVLEHSTGFSSDTLMDLGAGKIVWLFLLKRYDQNVTPHGVIVFIHGWLASDSCAQINQVCIQSLVVFIQCRNQRLAISFNNLRLQFFYTAEIIHNDGAVRPVGKIARLGVAMNALKTKQLVGHRGENSMT